MKKTFIIAIGLFGCLFSACDVIDDSERLLPAEKPDFNAIGRVVLLEEFTGVRCVNCPTGAAKATELIEWSGHHIIPVSIHCGSFAMAGGFWTDFKTEAGDAYFEEFQPELFPSCLMNRGGSVNGNIDTWQAEFLTSAIERSPVDLRVETADKGDGRFGVSVSMEAAEEISTDVSLQLWLVESGIVGAQLTPEGINREYVHNHVLRKAINGTWGESVGTFSVGELKEKACEFTIDEAWNADNCAVVAFLFDTASKRGVIQAAEADLRNK